MRALTPLTLLLTLALGGQAHAEAPPRAGVPATAPASAAAAEQDRQSRIQAILPELDKMYAELAEKEHIPGLVYGVLLDGKLIHSRALGYANIERKLPATASTQFRIASMTKSFVAMAALKLRDQGKLQLDDPVSKYLPEMRKLRAASADAPVITLRHLLTMTTGLPEDNPWGDRQMALDNAALERLVGGGLSFSTSTGDAFEYSNLGYIMLGKVVSKVAGMRFQDFITRHLLQPLGMSNTCWEYAKVPANKLALGYRWSGSGWETEPILHDGDGAAMGGLITTMDDFARYVAFQLDAWPARNGAERGPLRRSSVREMQLPHAFTGMNANTTLVSGATLNPKVNFYGYGLNWTRDSREVVTVGHSGGLPGYGSQYRFAPQHGVAVIAFGNLRYAPVYQPTVKALNMLIEDARLAPRPVPPSPILLLRQRQVAELVQTWDSALGAKIAAENFFLDRSQAEWSSVAREQLAKIGKLVSVGPLRPDNQLRGSFTLVGEQGMVDVRFTLTPEREPKLQQLEFKPAKKM